MHWITITTSGSLNLYFRSWQLHYFASPKFEAWGRVYNRNVSPVLNLLVVFPIQTAFWLHVRMLQQTNKKSVSIVSAVHASCHYKLKSTFSWLQCTLFHLLVVFYLYACPSLKLNEGILVSWALWLGTCLLCSASTYLIVLTLGKLIKEAVNVFSFFASKYACINLTMLFVNVIMQTYEWSFK